MRQDLKDKIWNYYKKYYKDSLNLPNWENLVESRLNEERAEREKIKKLEKLLGNFSGKKILDVGCGTGGFLVEAAKIGAKVFGIDTSRDAFEICHLKGLETVTLGKSEYLPYPDRFFDVVYCYTVLEHVRNVGKTLKEMVRVAKVGGKIYIQAPNSLSFYEGHYKIFWLPKFPKPLAKIYLFLRGRPTQFVDTVNYLTTNKVFNFLKKKQVKINWVKNEFKESKSLTGKMFFLYYKFFAIDPQIEIVLEKK